MLLLCLTYILKTDGVTTSLLLTCWTKEWLRSAPACIYLKGYVKSKVAITNKIVFFWWGLISGFISPSPLLSFGNENPSLASPDKESAFLPVSALQSPFRKHVIFPHSSSSDPLSPCWLLLGWLASLTRCRSLSGTFEDIIFVHMDPGNCSTRVV